MAIIAAWPEQHYVVESGSTCVSPACIKVIYYLIYLETCGESVSLFPGGERHPPQHGRHRRSLRRFLPIRLRRVREEGKDLLSSFPQKKLQLLISRTGDLKRMGDREFVESTLFPPHSSFLYVFTGDFLRIVRDVFIPPPFSIRIKFFLVAFLFFPLSPNPKTHLREKPTAWQHINRTLPQERHLPFPKRTSHESPSFFGEAQKAEQCSNRDFFHMKREFLSRTLHQSSVFSLCDAALGTLYNKCA